MTSPASPPSGLGNANILSDGAFGALTCENVWSVKSRDNPRVHVRIANGLYLV
jgi:hypothetical protein